MGNKARVHVLIIGTDKIVSYAIGIEQPLSYLKKQGLCTYEVVPDDVLHYSVVARADVILFFRVVSHVSLQILEIAREMGKKTVYVIDDHFLAMSPNTDIGNYYHDHSRRTNYVKFLRGVDIVKVASVFFANHLNTHYKLKNIVYFPGSVDFSLFDGLEQEPKQADQLVIGYEGGQKLTAFQPVIQALQGIAKKYGDKIKFEFFGYVPKELADNPQVSTKLYTADYQGFLKSLYCSNWDIGLAPLERTLLHDCKTNNKYREYGACRIPGIYTASPAYTDWVVHRKTGMLVSQTVIDWYEALVELIEHPELREKIKDHAQQNSRENFSVEACSSAWFKQILSH